MKRQLLKVNVSIWFNNMQSEGFVPKYVNVRAVIQQLKKRAIIANQLGKCDQSRSLG
jgi:hypothetical protein